MLTVEDKPYRDYMEDPYQDYMENWLKRIGYSAEFYENHTPVRAAGPTKRLTKRERERVDSLSRDRGYRRFCAYGRAI